MHLFTCEPLLIPVGKFISLATLYFRDHQFQAIKPAFVELSEFSVQLSQNAVIIT